MSPMVGADLEQVRALAADFDRAAAQLHQTSTTVRSGIQISAWAGPFAIRFRHTWDSQHSVKLRQAATALAAQAKQLRLEADQQDRASAASTGTRYSGGRLSDRDLVDFAESGTSDKDGIIKNGYTQLSKDELKALGIDPKSLRDPATGFDAKVYRDGAGHIIVTFGGTQDGVDVATDVAGASPHVPTVQGMQSVALAKSLVEQFGVDNVVFTGQSLGGRNAAIASLATGARAVTFNAAGVGGGDYAYAATAGGSPVALVPYAASFAPGAGAWAMEGLGRPAPHVTNYYTDPDPLTRGQQISPAPNAVGEQHQVDSSHTGGAAHGDYPAFERGVPD